jgi:hypothetical protein
MYVRPRNHHLLDLAQVWQVARDDSRIHIILHGHKEGRYGPFLAVRVPQKAPVADAILEVY